MNSRAYLYTNQICRQCIPNALVVGTPEDEERSDLRLIVKGLYLTGLAMIFLQPPHRAGLGELWRSPEQHAEYSCY